MTTKRKKKLVTTRKRLHGKIPPERLADVAELMARRFSPGQIEEQCAKEWSISTRTVRRYMAEVTRRWIAAGFKQADTIIAEERSRNKETLNLVIREASTAATGDKTSGLKPDGRQWRYVLQAVDKLARMNGDYNDKVQVTGAGGQPLAIAMTADEAAMQLAAVARTAERAARVKQAVDREGSGGGSKP